MHLKDCFGNTILSSRVGETREKQFAQAYNLALRDAFVTYQEVDYNFRPEENTAPDNNALTIKTDVADNQENNESNSNKTLERSTELPLADENNDEKAEVPSVIVSATPEIDEITVEKSSTNTTNNVMEILYAQPMQNGFQIVDTSPKKVMFLLNTEIDNVFLVKGKNAIVYNSEGKWYYSETDEEITTNVINLKF